MIGGFPIILFYHLSHQIQLRVQEILENAQLVEMDPDCLISHQTWKKLQAKYSVLFTEDRKKGFEDEELRLDKRELR